MSGEFEKFYLSIQSCFEYLEELREQALKEYKRNNSLTFIEGLSIIFGIFIGGTGYWMLANNQISYKVFFTSILVSLFFCIFFIYNILQRHPENKEAQKTYNREYKKRITQPMIKLFFNIDEYYPDKQLEEEIYYKEAEFDAKLDLLKFSSENLINGKFNNGSKYIMATVLTEIFVSRGDHRRGRYEPVFNGIVIKIETPKKFEEKFYLRKDRKDRKEKYFRQKLPFDELCVKINNLEFEQMFDVYCSNQNIANQILTNENIKYFMSIYHEFRSAYEITIKDGYVYIKFNFNFFDNLEPPKLKKSSLDKETLNKCYNNVKYVYDFSNKIINILDGI